MEIKLIKKCPTIMSCKLSDTAIHVSETSQHTPTDDELLGVATEIIKVLQDNWIILQAAMNIPDHIMSDILHQTTMHQQVFR